MKLQVLFMSLAALAGIGFCDGAQKDNIFGVDYGDTITLLELKEQLSEQPFQMEAKTVAGLLARATPKDSIAGWMGFLTVNNLLELAEINTDKPMEACERNQFLAFVRMCGSFSPYENNNVIRHHLSGYCKHSIKKRFEFCSSQVGKISELTDKKTLFGEEIMEYSKEFSAWIQNDGDVNGTEEDNVLKFRRSNPNPARNFARKCSVWIQILKAHLLFFDEDGKKTSAYFASDEEAALLGYRCGILAEDHEARQKHLDKLSKLMLY